MNPAAEGVDLKVLEEFQRRVLRTAVVLWMAALAIGLLLARAWSPLVGGLVLGGLASLVAFRYKVWAYRRLADAPTPKRAARLPMVSLGRYLVMAPAVALAVYLASVRDTGYLVGAAAGLLLGSVATVLQAVVDARRENRKQER